MNALLSRTVRFFKRNPSAALVVGFQALLITAAILLIIGSSLAEAVGSVAYFVLVAGVVLQLVSYLRGSHGE
jgi:hypothetical protein